MIDRNTSRVRIGFHSLLVPAFVVAVACSMVGATISQKIFEGPFWEGVGPFMDPRDVVGLRTLSSVCIVLGKHGPHGELFFFVIKKEPFAFTRAVEFKPFVPVETLNLPATWGY